MDTAERLEALRGKGIRKGEGAYLYMLASAVPAGLAIVEIGSHRGKSSSYLAAGAAMGYRARVHCVDLWDLGTHPENAAPEVYPDFQRQIAQMGLAVTPWRGASVDVAARWKWPVGLLFIDGAHGYDDVCGDFEAWSPFLVSGGTVAFHDYGNPRCAKTVKRFVDRAVGSWPAFRTVETLAIARKP